MTLIKVQPVIAGLEYSSWKSHADISCSQFYGYSTAPRSRNILVERALPKRTEIVLPLRIKTAPFIGSKLKLAIKRSGELGWLWLL